MASPPLSQSSTKAWHTSNDSRFGCRDATSPRCQDEIPSEPGPFIRLDTTAVRRAKTVGPSALDRLARVEHRNADSARSLPARKPRDPCSTSLEMSAGGRDVRFRRTPTPTSFAPPWTTSPYGLGETSTHSCQGQELVTSFVVMPQRLDATVPLRCAPALSVPQLLS